MLEKKKGKGSTAGNIVVRSWFHGFEADFNFIFIICVMKMRVTKHLLHVPVLNKSMSIVFLFLLHIATQLI